MKFFRQNEWHLRKCFLIITCMFICSTLIFLFESKWITRNKNMLKQNYKNKLPTTKQSTEMHRNTIITFNQTSWSYLNHNLCTRSKNFSMGLIRMRRPKRNIPIFVYSADDDVHISRVLLNGGLWEEQLLNKIIMMIGKYPESIFLDIGAHVGVYALTIASFGYSVIAIDSYIENVKRICASSKIGNIAKNISIVYNALSKTRKRVFLKQMSMTNVGSNSVLLETETPLSKDLQVVQAIKLDDLLEIFRIKSAVIKMDVEGHEHFILMGAEKFFKEVNVHFVLMEFTSHKNSTSGKFIIDFMSKHGFQPDLPKEVNLLQVETWPWNVQWFKTNIR